jgi:seryl-tRNA(Sec) selenium transferase
MLTYYYALISDPSESRVNAFMDYVRVHPGCLLTLTPADSRALRRAIAMGWKSHQHEIEGEGEESVVALDRRALN